MLKLRYSALLILPHPSLRWAASGRGPRGQWGSRKAGPRLYVGCGWRRWSSLEGVSNRTAGAASGHDCHWSPIRKSYLMEVMAIISEGLRTVTLNKMLKLEIQLLVLESFLQLLETHRDAQPKQMYCPSAPLFIEFLPLSSPGYHGDGLNAVILFGFLLPTQKQHPQLHLCHGTLVQVRWKGLKGSRVDVIEGNVKSTPLLWSVTDCQVYSNVPLTPPQPQTHTFLTVPSVQVHSGNPEAAGGSWKLSAGSPEWRHK